MTTIIDLAQKREVFQARRTLQRASLPKGGADILLFTGVRYEREYVENPADFSGDCLQDTPRRKKKS